MVDGFGNFSVDVFNLLVEGEYSVMVIVIDVNGNIVMVMEIGGNIDIILLLVNLDV